MKNLFDLNGRPAVVIGGTGVLGGAMCQALAAAGAPVAVVGRSRERGEQRVAELRQSGGVAEFFEADALSADSLSECAERVEQRLGGVSILVNAAGGNRAEATLAPGQDFGDLPLEAWRQVFDLNLVGGVLLPCQAFARSLKADGQASIINIASMSGMIPLSRVVAYSAAKAAVINLTQFLAQHWSSVGIRVNAISPGFFPAEQNRQLLFQEDGSYTARGAQIVGHTPMGRFGRAEELGGTLVWLASAAASGFVTGQNIPVDGGFSAMTI